MTAFRATCATIGVMLALVLLNLPPGIGVVPRGFLIAAIGTAVYGALERE